jgi:hypothetical protein
MKTGSRTILLAIVVFALTPFVSASGQSVDAIEARPIGLPTQSTPLGTEPETSPAELGTGITRTIFALAAVVGLAIVMALVYRQVARTRGGLTAELGAGGRAPSGVLSILGRYPIARGQTLVLLQMGPRVLLLNQAQATGRHAGPAFTTLSEMTDAEEVADLLTRVNESSPDRTNARFEDALARLESQPEQSPEVVDLTNRPGQWIETFLRSVPQAIAGVGRRP